MLSQCQWYLPQVPVLSAPNAGAVCPQSRGSRSAVFMKGQDPIQVLPLFIVFACNKVKTDFELVTIALSTAVSALECAILMPRYSNL